MTCAERYGASNGAIDTRVCSTEPCPVDCLGRFEAWGPCSSSCGLGQQERTFVVERLDRGGGTICNTSDGTVETQLCTGVDCVSTSYPSLLNGTSPASSTTSEIATFPNCHEEARDCIALRSTTMSHYDCLDLLSSTSSEQRSIELKSGLATTFNAFFTTDFITVDHLFSSSEVAVHCGSILALMPARPEVKSLFELLFSDGSSVFVFNQTLFFTMIDSSLYDYSSTTSSVTTATLLKTETPTLTSTTSVVTTSTTNGDYSVVETTPGPETQMYSSLIISITVVVCIIVLAVVIVIVCRRSKPSRPRKIMPIAIRPQLNKDMDERPHHRVLRTTASSTFDEDIQKIDEDLTIQTSQLAAAVAAKQAPSRWQMLATEIRQAVAHRERVTASRVAKQSHRRQDVELPPVQQRSTSRFDNAKEQRTLMERIASDAAPMPATKSPSSTAELKKLRKLKKKKSKEYSRALELMKLHAVSPMFVHENGNVAVLIKFPIFVAHRVGR